MTRSRYDWRSGRPGTQVAGILFILSQGPVAQCDIFNCPVTVRDTDSGDAGPVSHHVDLHARLIRYLITLHLVSCFCDAEYLASDHVFFLLLRIVPAYAVISRTISAQRA